MRKRFLRELYESQKSITAILIHSNGLADTDIALGFLGNKKDNWIILNIVCERLFEIKETKES